jgi:hypothetical protein
VTGDVPDEDLSVEIGGAAWAVLDGQAGSAGLSAPEPQVVRLIRVADCEELARVEADPGSAHAFVFDADGQVSVEDRTSDQDAGAPLERRERADCG